MSYPANVYRVFIASPGDVSNERNLIRSVVYEWNSVHSVSRGVILDPVGWETHATPAMGGRAQELINKQILKDCDILIAVFWTRLGTATGDYASGTVEEIEEHIAAGKPAMIYFSSAPVRMESVDEEQYLKLKEFKKSLLDRGLVESFDEPAEFAQKLNRQLSKTLNDDSIFVGLGGSGQEITETLPVAQRASHSLSNEALFVLEKAAKSDGRITMIRHMGGVLVQAGSEPIDTSSPRLSAKWQGAIDELTYEGFAKDLGKGQIFEVTEKGYQLVEVLRL